MKKPTSETTDVEWVPQNLSQTSLQAGNSCLLDFQPSFIGEKGGSEKEWDLTVWSSLKHLCALVMSSVLLMEIERLSVT